ncbi:MAG: hypothetical protein AAF726_10765 [Planctomycetota bacterium]
MSDRITKLAEYGFGLRDAVELASSDVWSIQRSWRERFSKQIFLQTGKWTYGGTDWHTFTHGFCEHLAGRRALAELQARLPAKVYLHSGDSHPRQWGVAATLESYAHPVATWSDDVFVSDVSFGWTFVMTHHDEGPFYSDLILSRE